MLDLVPKFGSKSSGNFLCSPVSLQKIEPCLNIWVFIFDVAVSSLDVVGLVKPSMKWHNVIEKVFTLLTELIEMLTYNSCFLLTLSFELHGLFTNECCSSLLSFSCNFRLCCLLHAYFEDDVGDCGCFCLLLFPLQLLFELFWVVHSNEVINLPFFLNIENVYGF